MTAHPGTGDRGGDRRVTWILATLALALFGLVAGTGIVRSWHSFRHDARVDPGRPRPWAADGRAALVDPPASGGAPDSPTFRAAVVTPPEMVRLGRDPRRPEAESILLVVRDPEESYRPASEVVAVPAADGWRTPDGSASLEVAWIAARTLAREHYDGDTNRLGLAFFHPELEPMAGEAVDALEIDPASRSFPMLATRPGTAFRMRLAARGLEDARWNLAGIVDAATGVRLADAKPLDETLSGIEVAVSLPVFHPVPLVVALDVVHGPVRVAKLEARPGATTAATGEEGASADVSEPAALLPFAVEILAVAAGGVRGIEHARGRWWKRDVAVHLDAPSPAEPAATFVLLVPPPALADALTFEAVPVAGSETSEAAVLAPRDRRSAGPAVIVLEFDRAPSDIARLWVSWRPHRKRFLVEIPALPGTPAANRDLDDLLDAVVPWIVIGDDASLRRTLAHALEFRETGAGHGYTGSLRGSRVSEVEQITVRGLIELQRRRRPEVEVLLHRHRGIVEFVGPGARRPPWWRRLIPW